jgi:hypothetical protein
MLHIIEQWNDDYHTCPQHQKREWHVGDRKPQLSQACVEVRAYGEELTYIRARFTNLPDHMLKAEIVWKGEWAQFIYDNL